MKEHCPNFFAGPYLDRRSEARESPDWLPAALADADSVYMVVRGTSHLLYTGDAPRIAFLTGDDPLVRGASERQFVLLGWFRNARCVLLDLTGEGTQEFSTGAGFHELRSIAEALPEQDAGLLAYARALSVWRARCRYCGACGARTDPRQAGHVMRCSNPECAQDFFPRLDPAIIVLVSDGERVLLGRQSIWPVGRYSTLAGFVEPGEGLEDAVAREVWEETGVQVEAVSYRSSQPWPFPSSLMVGFHASAAPGSIIRLNGELEEARWFTPQQITAMTMPLSYSISHRLIAEWLASR